MQYFKLYKTVLLMYGYFLILCTSTSGELDWLDDMTNFPTSTSEFSMVPGFDSEDPNIAVDPTVSAELIQASNTLVELYQTDSNYRDLMSNITEICPGWLPCNVLRAPEFGTQCCLICFCDDDCGVTRPCCPGFKSNETGLKESEYKDVPTICVESVYFTENKGRKNTAPDFEMIADCPDGTPEFLRDKCVAMFTEQDVDYIHAFVDIIPVTHTESLTNFANKHCAACHGLSRDRYRKWGARVICTTEILFDSEEFEADVQLSENCYLQVIPPSFKIGNTTQCITEMTTQCNITGLWETYDPITETFCSDVYWYYKPKIVEQAKESILVEQRYKNIFCAICNGDTYNTEEYTGICPATGFEGVMNTFTFLANYDTVFREQDQEMTTYNHNRCPLGWMVDPLSNSCQEVVCSFPRILNILDMTCEERFASVTFGSAEIPFKFELDSSDIFKLRGLPQFHEHFLQALEPLIVGSSCNYHSIFYKTDTSYDVLTSENYISGADDDIISGIVILYASFRLETGFSSYESVLTVYLNSNVTVAGIAIELEYDRTETAYLPTATTSARPDRTITLGGERNADIFSVYRDPFDGIAVLKVGESFDVNTCVSNNLLYRKSYYDCPAFVYETSTHGINYTATGMNVSGVNAEFNFGEFRSLNETHVAICLNMLEEKGFSVKDTLSTSDCAHRVFYLLYSQIALIAVVIFNSYTDDPLV